MVLKVSAPSLALEEEIIKRAHLLGFQVFKTSQKHHMNQNNISKLVLENKNAILKPTHRKSTLTNLDHKFKKILMIHFTDRIYQLHLE